MARRISLGQKKPAGSKRPEAELAALIKRDTGIVIEPKVIHDFIRDRFTTISVLAHEIWEPHTPPGLPK